MSPVNYSYSEYRDLIRSGDILAWSHKGMRNFYDFKVWLVRLFTRSAYTHVGIAWVVGKRVFILEAVGAGVRIYPLSLELPFYHVPWDFLTEAKLELALSKAGQRYSYWECVKAYFRLNDKNDNNWECAEYVCVVHNLPCGATPAAVIEFVSKGEELVEITGG